MSKPTDFFLEDAIEATGFAIGRSSKWAKKGGGSGGKKGAAEEDGGSGGTAVAGADGYSEQTRIGLFNVDESLINTDLIEALVTHLLGSRQRQQGGGGRGDDANAILIFAPGEPTDDSLLGQPQGGALAQRGSGVCTGLT